jgi:hypothetical protein
LTAQNNDLVGRIRNRVMLTRHEPRDDRYRLYSVLLFSDIQEQFNDTLARLGKTFADFSALPDETITGLFDFFPTLDVERALTLAAEQQQRQIQPNDVYDIAALTAAIPYCDIVITERFWAHLCNATTLPHKYQTTILPSLADLTRHLAQNGTLASDPRDK